MLFNHDSGSFASCFRHGVDTFLSLHCVTVSIGNVGGKIMAIKRNISMFLEYAGVLHVFLKVEMCH